MADDPNPDALAASRLPDLPDAGYSSDRQKRTSDLIMGFLRSLDRNAGRLLLLTIICDGEQKFKKIARKAWHLDRATKAVDVPDELLDAVWRWMCVSAGPNPQEQLVILEAQQRQIDVGRWDKRLKTSEDLERKMRETLQDVRAEHRRLKNRHTVS